MRFHKFTLILLTLSALCCSKDKRQPAALTETGLVSIYAERLIIYEEAKISGQDSSAIRTRMDSLYASFNVSGKQVDEAVDSYKKDLTEWKRFYDQVVKRLDQLQQNATGKNSI